MYDPWRQPRAWAVAAKQAASGALQPQAVARALAEARCCLHRRRRPRARRLSGRCRWGTSRCRRWCGRCPRGGWPRMRRLLSGEWDSRSRRRTLVSVMHPATHLPGGDTKVMHDGSAFPSEWVPTELGPHMLPLIQPPLVQGATCCSGLRRTCCRVQTRYAAHGAINPGVHATASRLCWRPCCQHDMRTSPSLSSR